MKHVTVQEWRDDFTEQAGRNTFILKTNGNPVLPSMANPTRIIEAADNNISLLSRFVRAVTNHAPTGEYRRRWHPNCPNTCPHDHNIHTRNHILTECSAYSRAFSSTR